MEKKKIIKIIVLVVISCVLILCLFVGFRYFKCREVIGKYELISGTNVESNLKLDLYKWTRGEKKDLDCNLWNCSDYSNGNYDIDKSKLIFHLSGGTITYYYKIKKSEGATYLILTSDDSGSKNVEKYKKIK